MKRVTISLYDKEQMITLKEIIKYVKPYIKQFVIAIFLSSCAVINAVQPRIIQTFIDDCCYRNSHCSTAVMFGAIYLFNIGESGRYLLNFIYLI